MQPETHLCLVSNQPVPNLTPVLDRRFAPRRVVLLVSPAMRQHAEWLRQALEGRARCELLDIDDAWNIPHIRERVAGFLDRRPELAASIALNATGGTKPMSMAAYEVFRQRDLPVFYVHPPSDSLLWLHPQQPQAELEDRMRIELYLQANGMQVAEAPGRSIRHAETLEAARRIAASAPRFKKVIPMLNHLAMRIDDKRVTPRLKHIDERLAELLDLFQQAGVLRLENRRIHFRSEADRFFASGGWLEQLVFDELRRLRQQDPHIHDIAYGVKVVRERGGERIHNELDVVFLRDNRLHIIECKTARIQGKAGGGAGNGIVYKLDSLRDLIGGLHGRAMLISFDRVSPGARKRAGELHIPLCTASNLRRLPEHLMKLVET